MANDPVPTNPDGTVVNLRPTRDELRAAFFDPQFTEVKPTQMTWNGVTFDWYRPTIKQLQEAQDNEVGEGRNFMVRLICDYSYMPGTKERLFEDEDYERLINMPLSTEWQENIRKIGAAIGLGVEEKAKN